MKADILEQVVEEYLQHRGYFTMHNVRFKHRREAAKIAASVQPRARRSR